MKRSIFILGLILVSACAVRAYGLNFPRFHWDENIAFDNTLYASYAQLREPTYVHGSLLSYLFLVLWYAYLLLHGVAPTAQNLMMAFFRDSVPFVVVARSLLVLAGTGTVLGVYLLGKQMYNRSTGLLAAFFLAFIFLHVSESHYARGHILATFFVTLAVFFASRILGEGRGRDYALAGVCVGLATAAQYSAILAIIPLIVAHGLWAWKNRQAKSLRAWMFDRSMLLGLDCAAAAFFIATPYALLDFSFFAGEMKWFLTSVVSRTWVSSEGQPVWLFYLTEHLRNGMGSGLELVALVGIIYAVVKRTPWDWIILAFPLPLFFTLARGENFARYALLLLPFLSIAAARVICDMMLWAEQRWSKHWAWGGIVIVFAIVLVIPSALNIARYDFMLTQPDTRALASEWISANIPDGATVVVEGAGVLGPAVPTSIDLLDRQLAAQDRNSAGYIYLQSEIANQHSVHAYNVDTVFRLDQQHVGGILVGSIQSADYYANRGIDYMITVSWMQSESESGYSNEFQDSLMADYTRIAEFAPTIDFQFDPYAWRMDYAALGRVNIGQALVGGPVLTIYQRRAAK